VAAAARGVPAPGSVDPASLGAEVARRRTFAIISHPDAGKTTLTEKLLLYSGAVQLAGAVRARRRQRAAISDWMAMERERGISITSTVLAFDYRGFRLSLLDTPGHADFSEDTYRTLTAVDAAVMVLDAARGVEEQTAKLHRVCRARQLPVLTFVNKLDRPGLPPLEILDRIERELGIVPVPMNWPIGDGPDFQGVYDRETRTVHRFERVEHGARQVPVRVASLDDPQLAAWIGAAGASRLREDVALLDAVGPGLDRERFLAGEQTPVFFGSALTNFGVELFLHRFLELAPAPVPVGSAAGGGAGPSTDFAGFVFKIQSNMNPLHRDSMAFVRVTRGIFRRDAVVTHLASGRRLRLGQASSLFAQERETVDVAYPGDVIGVANPGLLAIGDVLYVGAPPPPVVLPVFQPEHFAILRNPDVTKQKSFLRGVEQLEQEGAVQVWQQPAAARREPLLAAVGRLQFEVVQYRLRAEYGVETQLEPLPYSVARWLAGPEEEVAAFRPWGVLVCADRAGRPVALFPNARELAYHAEQHPRLRFLQASELPLVAR
jgi:peptide chain release factor 3